MTHPGSWGMISLSQYAWWPYMHREILAKASDCGPCTDIGKNLKPIIPKSKWYPHKACQQSNEEIQIDFGGPITNDKDKDIYFLTCIDSYSKYPTARVFEHANGTNVVKFLRDYAYTHGIPRTIRLDQATCLVDADKVPVAKYLDDAGWVNPERSDLDIETAMNKAQQDAGLRYRDSDDKESRFIIHPKLTNPIPRTEKSLSVKLARKLPNKKRAKRQLAGLYEVLKPGSFVTKSSPTTTIINEPGRTPVKVRDSDLAKFCTKAERSTNLWTYAQRRPAPYEQTTEIKIAKHSNDIKKQKRGEIKIRHRHRDTTSVVSSVNSNVSRALTVRKPTKSQPKRRRNAAPINDNDNATVQEQQLISIVPAPQMSSSQNQQTQDTTKSARILRFHRRGYFAYQFPDLYQFRQTEKT